MEDLEETSGPSGSMELRLLELIESYEEETYIPGDNFPFPGLSEKPGMKLVEATSVKMPEYDERDEEIYGDADIELNIIVHVDTANYDNYAKNKKIKKKMLSDVKQWILGSFPEDSDDINILKIDVNNSDDERHEVVVGLVCDGWSHSSVLGDVKDSPFYDHFWNHYMNETITEGVCYVKNKIPEELKKNLIDHIEELGKKTPIDYHPNSNDIVRDLVHPALYPYIKGISKVKKGVKLPQISQSVESRFDFWGRKYEDSKFQWLPTPFRINKDRKCHIMDYINNLDRQQFPELYTDLEKLFEIFLPYFEEVWSYSNAMKFFTNEEEDVELNEIPPFTKQPITFTDRTLQVIPKIVEYKLEVGQTYEGVWHAEGMSHENIVMTGIYFLSRDSTLTGGDLRYKRAFTLAERTKVFWEVPQGRPQVVNNFANEGFMPLGHFPTEEGYLLVFPNCHIHKISKIVNESQKDPARRQVVVFFVVNPDKKIISTSEIAQQQTDMSLATAQRYRLELMEERKYDKEKLNVRNIELCEH